jgi:hypothetical protein
MHVHILSIEFKTGVYYPGFHKIHCIFYVFTVPVVTSMQAYQIFMNISYFSIDQNSSCKILKFIFKLFNVKNILKKKKEIKRIHTHEYECTYLFLYMYI